MVATAYLLGIDGGGTKTVCLVTDTEGRVLGRGTGGPSNYLKEGLYITKQSLQQAMGEALDDAGVGGEQVEVLCAGLAGVSRREDREIVGRMLRELLPVRRLLLEIDAYVALAGATEGRPGVILVSGTGSIAFGVNPRGERARAGGWGHLVGDEGSGFDLARRGLMAALRDYDGRGRPTILREKFAREFYLREFDELIPPLYSGAMTPSRVAALYPIVLEAAQEGDAVARELMREAAGALVELVEAVVRRLSMDQDPFPLALSGGVFRGEGLREELKGLLAGRLPRGQLITPRHPPEMGAILAARAAWQGRSLFAF